MATNWFEQDQTQKLQVCADDLDSPAMLGPTDGPRIRASHLVLEPRETTDYIRVMFHRAESVVEAPKAKPSGRRYLLVPIGALLIAVAAAAAFL